MSRVDACVVGGTPAPAFERLLNQVLNKPAPDGWPSIETVARVSGARYEAVRHYFAGGACAHHTIRRVEADLAHTKPRKEGCR